MASDWPWRELGLEGPVALRDVKRAYSKRLKAIDRSDAEAFQALRQAFDAGKEMAGEAPQEKTTRPDMRSLAQQRSVPQRPRMERQGMEPDSPKPPPDTETLCPPIEEAAPELQSEVPHEETPDGHEHEAIAEESIAGPSPFDVQAFWGRVEDALAPKSVRPFEVPVMRRVLQDPVAQMPEVRRELERRLYDVLDNYVTDASRTVPTLLAVFYEQEFHWLSDGQAMRRAAGWSSRMQELAHVLHMSMPIKKQKRGSVFKKLRDNYWPHRIVCVLITTAVCSRSNLLAYGPVDFIIMSIVFGIICAVLSLVILAVWIPVRAVLCWIGLTDRLVDQLQRYAPRHLLRLQRSDGYIHFLGYFVAMIVLCVGSFLNI